MTRFLLGVIACLVVLLFVREGCNGAVIKRLQKQTPLRSDNTFLHDTVYQTAYVPKPYAVRSKAPENVSLINKGNILTPVPCNEVVYYRDTVVFQYGNVVLNDQVQDNRIISRQPTWSINVPVVKEPVKQRNEVFAGIGATYTLHNTAAFGPSLMLKTKRGKAYEVSGMMDNRGNWVVGAGVKFKISFGR